MIQAKWLIIAITTSLVLGGCTYTQLVKEFSCNPSPENKPSTQSNPLKIAIHVDGSGSMLGYVKANNSRYIQTLELLDQTLSLGGLREAKTSTEYYRSGTPKPIGRGGFRNAKQPVFYDGSDPSRFKDVSVPIDEAITVPEKEDTLLAIITDLDQAQGDVTELNQKIQKNYLNSTKKGYAVGILAVKSEFDGTVYIQEQDRIQKFIFPNQNSKEKIRPFYVIFIGLDSDINQYFEQLKAKGGELIQESKLVIFSSNHLVSKVSYLDKNIKENSTQTSLKLKEWSLEDGSVKVQAKDSQNQLWELSKNQTETLTINDSVELSSFPSTLSIDSTSINVVKGIEAFDKFSNRFKKSNEFMQDDSSLKEAIDLNGWKIIDGKTEGEKKLSFVTQIKPEKFAEPGIYLFSFDILAKGLQEQPWWEDWSWKEARDSTMDGSKTHNLLNFLRGLKSITTNLMEEKPPVIGHFCYGINKS